MDTNCVFADASAVSTVDFDSGEYTKGQLQIILINTLAENHFSRTGKVKFLESVDFKKLKHVLQRDVRVVGRH